MKLLPGDLMLDSGLSVSGQATLVDVPATPSPGQDPTCDLRVDRITDGTYAGHIQRGQSQAAITGTFACTKR